MACHFPFGKSGWLTTFETGSFPLLHDTYIPNFYRSPRFNAHRWWRGATNKNPHIFSMESSQSVLFNRVLACSALVQTNNAFLATKSLCRKPQHFFEFRLGVPSSCIFTDEQTWVCCWAGPMLLMLSISQLVNFQLEPNRLRLYFRLGTWISQPHSILFSFGMFQMDLQLRGTTCSESPRLRRVELAMTHAPNSCWITARWAGAHLGDLLIACGFGRIWPGDTQLMMGSTMILGHVRAGCHEVPRTTHIFSVLFLLFLLSWRKRSIEILQRNRKSMILREL